ncbi:ABC transporter permease [Blastococcus sp. BMG 814]|uniref:ABC transporter permease n=1 Tax=Blastococcus carthaginiensis TaxID=3050034 RepID=A0ABT9I677_9ACTN|nr:ABC transporter permease [Blastococcus carthaginiensis]MDP5181065.1 ABC transporter permease [Blastococcus carthaginiensis]
MGRWLTRWRLAVRIARRDARRARGRTALVLLMIGLPVLAVSAADTFARTVDVSAEEARPALLGGADARITAAFRSPVWVDPASGQLVGSDGPPAQEPWSRAEVAAALPEGSRVVEAVSGRTRYRTDSGYARVNALAADPGDPLLAGTLELVEGRLPSRAGEVAISPQLAERGLVVGQELALTRDDVPARIVGVVRQPRQFTGVLMLLRAERADLLVRTGATFYADVPGGLEWAAVQDLNEQGLAVLSREVAEDPPPAEAWQPGGGWGTGPDAGVAVLALIGVSILLEVVLLAGPAFAVGVRRQRRDLALLAAGGGAPGDLRRVVLASGLVLGGVGALLGVGLGTGLGLVLVPVIGAFVELGAGPAEVPVLDLVGLVAVAVLAGLAAAAVPARQAARMPVVDALAGRRGQARTSWRSPVLGLVLAAVGLALVVLGTRGTELGIAGGAVLLVLGVVAATPWLLGLLAPLARRLPISGRIAVRDATRNRGRTAPALAAVMATVAGITALLVGSASDSAQDRRDYQPAAVEGAGIAYLGGLDEQSRAQVAEALRDQVPGRDVHLVRVADTGGADGWRELAPVTPGCTTGPVDCTWFPDVSGAVSAGGSLLVVEAGGAEALTPRGLPETASRALAEGTAVVFGSGAVDERGEVQLAAVAYDENGERRVTSTAALPAVEVPIPPPNDGGLTRIPAAVLVPPSLADRLPVEFTPIELVVGGPGDPVTPEQERRADRLLSALGAGELRVERGWSDDLALPRLVLLALGSVLVLVATGTATGLALSDARPDFATLAALGAAPRTRRFVAMGSAAVIAGGGALLGTLVGLAPGIAVAYPLTSTDYGAGVNPVVDVPWLLLAAVAFAVPLMAVAVTGLVVRSRLPMVSRLPG